MGTITNGPYGPRGSERARLIRDLRGIIRSWNGYVWEALEVDKIRWPFPTWAVRERPFDWTRDAVDYPPPAVRRLLRTSSPRFRELTEAFYRLRAQAAWVGSVISGFRRS